MRTRRAVPPLLTLLAACGSPPPAPEAAPPPPIAVDKPQVRSRVFHEILFTPGMAYPGLELEYTLRDEAGHTIKQDKLRVGKIFEGGKPLVAGRPVVHLIVRPEDLIKVSGPARARSVLDPPPLPLDQIHTAQLGAAWRCHQREWEWQPGKELPPGLDVERMPEPGTVFLHNVCPHSRPLRDPSLLQSFRFRRRHETGKAWVDLKVTYNLDHPGGVTFSVELLDTRGASVLRPGCRLVLRQPAVTAGTVSDYSIEFAGTGAVERARRVASARITKVEQSGGGTHRPAVDQVCR